MFRTACSSRNFVFTRSRAPRPNEFIRCLTEAARQQVVRDLVEGKSVSHIDELSSKRRQQFEAAIRGVIPFSEGTLGDNNNIATRLPSGHHLLYFNTVVPTERLLADGTDTAFSPPSPWSKRLWAGGRIQFPQHSKFDKTENPRLVLIEHVRDARVTGSEGQEKIFVKIERRVGKPTDGVKKHTARFFAYQIKRQSEDDIGQSLVVESRDLCFLRGDGPVEPFERRHITPPKNPDYSHSLTPTPALLFRFSALTFNAHAIHIDPEYTRNVYGYPNLLVHGPLALVLMLEYARQTVYKIHSGAKEAPVITEIVYRNLAPLFVNEKMTICIKHKRSTNGSLSPSIASSSETIEGSAEGAKGGASSTASSDESDDSIDALPPGTTASESGLNIGEGFPTPPSGEESPVPSSSGENPKLKPQSPSNSPQSTTASQNPEYPQEWEIWIQTGQGDSASLAVRATVKIEAFDKERQTPKKIPNAKAAKSTKAGLSKKETEVLEKVRVLLEEKSGAAVKPEVVKAKKERFPKPDAQEAWTDLSAPPSGYDPVWGTQAPSKTPISKNRWSMKGRSQKQKAAPTDAGGELDSPRIRRVKLGDGPQKRLANIPAVPETNLNAVSDSSRSGGDGGIGSLPSTRGAFERALRDMKESS